MALAKVLEAVFDPAEELRAFSAVNASAGAIVSFTGQMRAEAGDGGALTALVLEGYGAMTLASIQDVVAEASGRFAISDALAVHRIGRILSGEPIVFVATAAAHRRAAFEAADWLMDQLKSNILVWKREERADGTEQWIEPTAGDAAALARWEQA